MVGALHGRRDRDCNRRGKAASRPRPPRVAVQSQSEAGALQAASAGAQLRRFSPWRTGKCCCIFGHRDPRSHLCLAIDLLGSLLYIFSSNTSFGNEHVITIAFQSAQINCELKLSCLPMTSQPPTLRRCFSLRGRPHSRRRLRGPRSRTVRAFVGEKRLCRPSPRKSARRSTGG